MTQGKPSIQNKPVPASKNTSHLKSSKKITKKNTLSKSPKTPQKKLEKQIQKKFSGPHGEMIEQIMAQRVLKDSGRLHIIKAKKEPEIKKNNIKKH